MAESLRHELTLPDGAFVVGLTGGGRRVRVGTGVPSNALGVDGDLYVSDDAISVAPGTLSACRGYLSTAQPILHATTTELAFDTEEYDDGLGLHSTSTNPSRVTAPVDGYLDLVVNLEYPANGTGLRYLTLMKNGSVGSGTEVGQEIRLTHSGTFAFQVAVTGLKLAAGEYVNILTRHTAGVSLNASGGQYTTYFTAKFTAL